MSSGPCRYKSFKFGTFKFMTHIGDSEIGFVDGQDRINFGIWHGGANAENLGWWEMKSCWISGFPLAINTDTGVAR